MVALDYKIESQRVRDHLVEALDYIYYYPIFYELTDERYPGLLPPDQMGPIRRAFSRLKGAPPEKYYSNIPQLEIPILDKSLEQHHPTLLVGGEICSLDGAIYHSSFSLCVTFCSTNHSTEKSIVRRFHFDHQPYEKNRPPSHVQYGGHFPGTGSSTALYDIEDIDNPRLHYLPMDFVLVLDLAINDFETPLAQMARESDWKNLVQKSQQIWWRDYLHWLKTHICDRDDCMFHDIIYS